VNGHRGTVRLVRDDVAPHGGPLWEAACQQGCSRYLTDGGWQAAMVNAVAHHWGSIHGWAEIPASAYQSVGWPE
jgi:hypothetical protein